MAYIKEYTIHLIHNIHIMAMTRNDVLDTMDDFHTFLPSYLTLKRDPARYFQPQCFPRKLPAQCSSHIAVHCRYLHCLVEFTWPKLSPKLYLPQKNLFLAGTTKKSPRVVLWMQSKYVFLQICWRSLILRHAHLPNSRLHDSTLKKKQLFFHVFLWNFLL